MNTLICIAAACSIALQAQADERTDAASAIAPPAFHFTLSDSTITSNADADVDSASTATPIGTTGYDLSWYTIDGGGGTSAAGGFTLSGTIGQPDAGTMSGSGYELAGGFWTGGDIVPYTPCPGDLNGDNVVNVSDLLLLLGAWGPCADPGNCPADLNGDNVVNVSDLLQLLGAWGACSP